MRELKFRAWDVQVKEMFDVSTIDYMDNLVYVNSKTRSHVETRRRISDKVCKIMQYIGLKDKNGKEIYEGDIIETIRKGEGKTSRGSIVYDHEVGAYYLSDLGMLSDFALYDKFDIVGNIYENKDLLEE